ncbi:MAG: rhodanese-like domain-containing protein [Candidatus Dormibacteraeota bacterium]|nr:rhodanese-like domain-containing protein [Candidatus Dormibacteraeota bacterium]
MARIVDRETVQKMVNQGAQLVEVLPAEEYQEDHLPGAVSHPLKQLDEEVGEIDRNRAVIVYCWDSA